MANALRGEAELRADGRDFLMRLTLGALAELEGELDCDGLSALAERFDDGRFRTRDVVAVLGAGLRGAGADVTDAEVSSMAIEGGAAGAAAAATRLLRAAFTGGAE